MASRWVNCLGRREGGGAEGRRGCSWKDMEVWGGNIESLSNVNLLGKLFGIFGRGTWESW